MMNAECPCFDKDNLTKHKNRDTGSLRTTSWYSEVTAETSVVVGFMSLIQKTRFEKIPKVRDVFDSAWRIILAVSNSDRIEIIYIPIIYLSRSFNQIID